MKKLFKVCAVLALSAMLATVASAETITFNTRTEAEAAYIYEEMGSNDPGDGKSRFHDGWNYIIYEFPVAEGDKFAELTWKMQAQYKVSVTNADPDDWDNYDVIDMNEPTEEEAAAGTANWGYANGIQYPTYDLSAYLEGNETGKIWVMMGDATEDNGWGGYIFGDFPVTFYSGAEPAPEIEKPKTLAEIQAESIAKIEEGTQGFVVFTDTETKYLNSESGVGNSVGSKFMDGAGYVIYEFTVDPADTHAAIEWVLNNQYKIDVNVKDPADESAWVTAYEAVQNEEEIANGNADWGSRQYIYTPDLEKDDPAYEAGLFLYRHDLSEYLAGNSGKIWIRMGDVTTDTGWGGYISNAYPVTFKSGTTAPTFQVSGLPLFSTGAIEEAAAEVPAETPEVEEPEVVDTPAVEPAETVETPAATETEAAQTFDAGIIAAVAAVVSLAGYAVSKKH